MYSDLAGGEYQPTRLAEMRKSKSTAIGILKLGRVAIKGNYGLIPDTDPVYDRALYSLVSYYGRLAKQGDITNKAEFASIWDFFGEDTPYNFSREYETGKKAIENGTADMWGFNKLEFLSNVLGEKYLERHQRVPYRKIKTF